MITTQHIDDFFTDTHLKLRIYEFYGNSSRRNREAFNILDGYKLDDERRNISVIIMIIERDDYYDVIFNNIAKAFKIDKQNNWHNNIIGYIAEMKMKK